MVVVVGSNRFPIVGIGASADGIVAMEGLFRGLPADCGMAFVVVTHLSADRESMLHEVVGRYTNMPVVVAEDRQIVDAGAVYIMPHNVIMTIADGRLLLRKLDDKPRTHKPVDIFFGTLANDQGEYAVGIVLSGGDLDGTLGIKAIKKHGGLTIAQSADHWGRRNPHMPDSAIASGLIDLTLPAEDIGAKLLEFCRSFDLLADLGRPDGEKALEDAKPQIYEILRAHSGHDFSGYKPNNFLRRVRRRMQLAQLPQVETYLDRLRESRDEVDRLFRDLLINVTDFFRDTDAFKMLEDVVIPEMLAGRGANDTVRIWVPGCATGEEVYSIGMLMRERMDKMDAPPRVTIFATDIDVPMLGVARAGRYPTTLLENVTPERRARFFTNDGNSAVVVKDLRDLCVFSPHSVIKDPPFARMDLVSCRNLLIYFGAEIQDRVIPTFHYALKPGGFLFLGTAESIGRHGDLFVPLDTRHRIFRARERSAALRMNLLLTANDGKNPFGKTPTVNRDAPFPLRQVVESLVLARYSPAHVVVNADGDVVYYSANTGRYLEARQGTPTRHLLGMARRDLRLELRRALHDCIERGERTYRESIALEEPGERVQYVNITVEPLAECGSDKPLFLVLFEASGPVLIRRDKQHDGHSVDGMADVERELRDTKELLQSTIEEYETALEELKSSNEELVSVNEASQSTNEELEASKEEMRWLNEELNTVNAELAAKVDELDRASSDLKSLYESTEIATVFLDMNLVIRSFTPAASSFFNFRPSDIGRPLTDLAGRLDHPDLKHHIAEVFRRGEKIEHQLARDELGVHYLVRLIPYQTGMAKIEGVVITFIDVTTIAEAEKQQRVLIAELNHRVKNMLAVVISMVNQTARRQSTTDEFSKSLIGRLYAMSRAYGVLSRENWNDVALEELLRLELAPFGLDQISLSGPDVRLKPQQGLTMWMVIHELATNAAKYGGLSQPSGHLQVDWTLDNRNFRLHWQETGGPPVHEPTKIGFGLTLVKGEISYRLSGKIETRFMVEGLDVVMSLPLGA